MDNLKIAVVDDSWEWRMRTVSELRLILGEDVLLTEFESGDALILSEEIFDLVFLDIEMPGRDGFETALIYRGAHPKTLIVLLTTHTEYWKKGYTVGVFRFLEKTNLREDIRETIAACRNIFKDNKLVEFVVPKGPNVQVRIDNIIYIETRRPYINIYTKQGLIESSESIKDAMEKINDEAFFQCHRAYIVNLEAIKDIKEDLIHLKNGERILLSSRRKKELTDRFFKYKFERANQ